MVEKLVSGQVIATVGGSRPSNEQKSTMCGICSPVKKTTTPIPPGMSALNVTGINSKSSIAYGSVDKRVSLTVSPKTYQRDESKFVEKVLYTLGSKTTKLPDLRKGSSFFGLLRNALGTSSGLIFPYTPTVTFNHQTNYNQVEIIHSNMSYNYYKNSPPPTISLDAKFTADNRDNALHMLSAIWFLIACSKCDFGERSKYAGLPPPVLYLNGYDHLIDNVPVVITSIRYSYPETKHYVNLVLDFSKAYTHRDKKMVGGDTTFDNENFCRIYTNSESSISSIGQLYKNKHFSLTDVDGTTSEWFADVWKDKSGISGSSRTTGINYSFWLPTDIQIGIGLSIQPNLIKTRKQWSLDDYKTGILLTDSGKNPSVWLPSSIKSDQLLSAMQAVYSNPVDGQNVGQEPTCDCTCEYFNFIPSGWTW